MDPRSWHHGDAAAIRGRAITALALGLTVLVAGACQKNSSGPLALKAGPTLTAQQAAYVSSLATSSAGATAQAVANATPESTRQLQPTVDALLPSYRIVRVEDVSHKALDGPLSSYSAEQLQALPLDKSLVYRVVVSPSIKSDQVRPLLTQVVTQLSTQDPDIDELTVFLYSDEALVGDVYDVGRALWGPAAGAVTPRIASTNDRQGYKLTIDVPPGLDDYLKQRGSNETKFGLTEAQRKEVFKEAVAAEDKAHAEADRLYPPDVPNPNIQGNNDTYDSLVQQYYADVRQPFGLTDDQLSQIEGEGLAKRWPFD